MHGSCRDVKDCAIPCVNPVEGLLHPSLPDHLFKRPTVRAHAIHQLRTRLRVKDQPGLILAQLPFMRPGIRIPGMHLHGQALPGIQELEQQGKFLLLPPGQFRAPQVKNLSQKAACQGTVFHRALQPGQCGHLQAFPCPVIRDRLSQSPSQLLSAPGGCFPVPEDGLHQQWIPLHLIFPFPRPPVPPPPASAGLSRAGSVKPRCLFSGSSRQETHRFRGGKSVTSGSIRHLRGIIKSASSPLPPAPLRIILENSSRFR